MNQEQINNFLKMVESLKKYRRAELLSEDDENIIEDLYTDPLEGNYVLKTLMHPNTTLLIGRKGTGKSTIIGRFQNEIRKTDNKLSLYIDVKTIFDQAKAQPIHSNNYQNILSSEDITKFLAYKNFLKKVLWEIQSEIKKVIFTNKIAKFFSQAGLTKDEFEKEMDKLFSEISKPKYEDVTAIQEVKLESGKSNRSSVDLATEGKISTQPSLSSSLKTESIKEKLNNEQFSSILQRHFCIIEFMEKVKKLLKKVGIQRIFICLDDASEIEENSLDVFIRTIVAPLNNLADEYFKFKIAFYPGRDRTPDIDRTKIDTLKLDYYDLYLSSGVDKIEEDAILCTKRLLEKRFKYFFGEDVNIANFFDTKTLSLIGYYKIIFQISSNVPRIIGKILWYASKRSINSGKKITKNVLQESAKEHYTNEIETMLTKSEYMEFKSYDEQFGRQHLKTLVNSFISKAKENKKKIGESDSLIFTNYTTNTAPSNYLFFPLELEKLVSTLEFNFFITKFSQQRDKDTREVSIYTLNYGLCQKENIIFDEKSDRKFRIERLFDYTKLIIDWAQSSEEIICLHCNKKYDISELEAIEKFGMMCPKCQHKACEIKKINPELPAPLPDIKKIPEKEFLVLNTLNIESPQNATQLAEELDVHYVSIGHRCGKNSNLQKHNLVERKEKKFHLDKQNRPYYYITDKSKNIYFQ